MYTALLLLITVIDASPALLIVNDPSVPGLVLLLVAIGGGATAFGISDKDAVILRQSVAPFAALALIPAAWMVIQSMPLPLEWAHPIWQSAATALDGAVIGSLSVDRGRTLVALSNYL